MTDPANPTTFYFGSSSGGDVYRSRAEGRTWQDLGIVACSLAVAPSRRRPSTR